MFCARNSFHFQLLKKATDEHGWHGFRDGAHALLVILSEAKNPASNARHRFAKSASKLGCGFVRCAHDDKQEKTRSRKFIREIRVHPWLFPQAARSAKVAAFTLLEVVLAVTIIALMTLTIYRFIELNLAAIRFSTQKSNDAAAMRALMAVIETQLNDLPRAYPGSLLGEAHKFNNQEADEMQWICGAGNGLFTQFADGLYKVTLALKPIPKTNTSELGVRRMMISGDENDTHWLRLLGDVDAMEITYFDQRLNSWVQNWTDPQSRPALARIRIWHAGADSAAPFEAVLPLPVMAVPLS